MELFKPIYRAPEVILDAGYTFSADIWSLGVLLWDLLERESLFDPHIPEKPDEYDDAVHLAKITSLLGYPPRNLISSGRRSSMFYDDNNPEIPRDTQPLSRNISFEGSISQIKGEEKTRFISFVKKMIKWKPEERSTAKELLGDPWLYED
uniref:non-specific serine/threonine protein kinase n=1 Tax=Bionectria ochroleuca TaxID=29856 RepID=A0A8H7KD53_BIOOC